MKGTTLDKVLEWPLYRESTLERDGLAQHEAARGPENRLPSSSAQSTRLPVRPGYRAILGPPWEETSIFSEVFRGLLVSIAHLGHCVLGVGMGRGCFYLLVTLNLTWLIAKERNDYLGPSSRTRSILLAKTWWQVPEAAGHTMSTVRTRERWTLKLSCPGPQPTPRHCPLFRWVFLL